MGLGQEEEEAWAETPRHVKPKSFRPWNDGEGEDDVPEPVGSEQWLLEDEGGKVSLPEAADGPCAGTGKPALAAADGAQEERSGRAEGGRAKAASEETESTADGATPVRAARAQVEVAQIPDTTERFWNGVRRSERTLSLAKSCRSEVPRDLTSSQKPPMPVSCLWSVRRPLLDAVASIPDKLVPGPCMSASSPSLRGNSAVRGHKGLPPSGSPSSWERLPSVAGPALRTPTSRTSARDLAGVAMTTPPAPARYSSIQADYWACVLPDSLPPSPDRSSPLWNPNQEYEELLDFTYPLKPGPRGPKPLEGSVPPDHILHDSGVDLDSFSLSAESSLRSPGTSAHHHPVPAPGLSPLASGRPGAVGLTASGCQGVSRPSHKCPLQSLWHPPPAARRLELSSPATGRLRGDGAGREEGAGPEEPRRRPRVPAGASVWATEEGSDSEEEYLSLPTRLTQVSSLERYLAAAPGAGLEPARQSSVGGAGPDWAVSGEGCGGRPCGALRVSGPHPDHLQLFREDMVVQGQQDPANQWERLAFSSSSSLRSSPPLSPLRNVLEGVPCLFTEKEEQHLQQDRNRVKGPLVRRIKTFCSQLEGLIHWLYRVAEMSDNLIPPKSNISSLRSSLQQYRQFRRDIAEHQSLTEDVLQKGESLLACMVENTPVLKSALGLISRQTGRLEEHAEQLYDSVLAAMDTMDDPDPVAKGNPASSNGTATGIWTGEEPVLVGSPNRNPFTSTDQAGDE